MNRESLKQHYKNYYKNQNLNQQKLEQLLNMSEAAHSSEFQYNKNRNWQKFAAAFVIAIMLPIGAQYFPMENNNNQLVSQEIALNHSKQLAIEFRSDNYDQLNKMMHKLDFKLVASKSEHLQNLTIIGGRYCSIRGNLAAQVRLIDKNGIPYTLYQTPLTDALKAEKTGTFLSGDTEIKEWNEGNLFFGLASSIIK